MNLCFESMCDVYLSKTLWEMVIPFWIFSKWPFGDVLYKWITCTFVFNTFFTFVYRFVIVTITTEWQSQMNTYLNSMSHRFQVQHRKYQSFLYKTFKTAVSQKYIMIISDIIPVKSWNKRWNVTPCFECCIILPFNGWATI